MLSQEAIMAKKYRVTLTAEERDELERLLARGKADVRKIKHAQILLKADEAKGGPAWPDVRIAEAVEAGTATVERVRRRFVEEGLASALSPYRGGKRLYERKLDGAQEAHLIALACSAPPDERARWTLRLLAQRMVELAYVDTLSHETVRQTLKKERPPAAPEKDVVHGWEALGRVRLPHGRRAGGLPPPVRSQAARGVRGRDFQTADRRDPRAAADAAGNDGAL
jgi:transposase